ncbi:hypothetical protein MHBO_005160 [Bonamia ostreae]|uniref:Ribosomal protein L32 n=1 Tax=Bonamia ostreae TaxID=126728 RepID=A0ABV2AV80_9EUKA
MLTSKTPLDFICSPLDTDFRKELFGRINSIACFSGNNVKENDFNAFSTKSSTFKKATPTTVGGKPKSLLRTVNLRKCGGFRVVKGKEQK